MAPWLAVGTCGGGFQRRWLRRLALPDVVAGIDAAIGEIDVTLDGWRALPEGEREGEALAITPWGLLRIACDGYVWPVEPVGPRRIAVSAIGSGGDYARGAIAVHLDSGDASVLAGLGVEIAADLDLHTGDGIDVLTMDAR